MEITIKKNIIVYAGISFLFLISSCSVPSLVHKTENKVMPGGYNNSRDSVNSATTKWKEFFTDPYLTALIDSALKNNQELNITMQEILIARNEIRARKGEYLPFLGVKGGTALDKRARYTNIGAMEANTDIKPGQAMPEPLPDYMLGAYASWEIDVWKKLRNVKKAAVSRYLSSVDGKNFMVTSLVAEIANSYYELIALDNQLEILKQNIEIQQDVFKIVKMEKDAARVTELAVKKFEAEMFKNQSEQFSIMQKITETENRINFLVGRFPQPVQRNSKNFVEQIPSIVHIGLPSQLLENRPDIKQAENDLAAARLDVKSTRANFYPSFRITGGVGYQAFNPAFFLQTPQSLLYSLAGELVAPVLNRNAIKAVYYSASYKQVQAIYSYEKTVLNAYTEVFNQAANINNLEKSYEFKSKQVNALTQSINISVGLFKSARADYMEVLLTQRDALESKIELIEIKKKQMNSMVNVYQALGGGWN